MENTTINKLLELASLKIASASTTAEKNKAIVEYNTLLESLESVPIEDQFRQLPHTEIPVNSGNQHIGIRNILTGICNNATKGKYTDSDKAAILSMLSHCTHTLESIDCSSAMAEKAKRKELYTNVRDKLNTIGI